MKKMKKLVKNDVFKNILIYSAIFITLLIAVLFIFFKLDKSLIDRQTHYT